MAKHQIFIDLGTTTLAFSDNYNTSYTAPNHQSAFGADIISRIKASCEGHGLFLQDIIKRDLINGITELKKLSNPPVEAVTHITIAANTAMLHLLMNYDCNGLASYPFTPVTLEQLSLPGDFLSISGTITLLPCASAFIGGDIISGLLSLNATEWEAPCLLLDLGTNAEMVLGTKNQFFATSAAAGPAFEGGGISCGVGGIKGAIYHIDLSKKPCFQTIDYGAPIGICGTGIIDLTAELLNHKYMDETGFLCEPYFEEGFAITKKAGMRKALTFTQKDIRQVQMAKAAIRTGIELLCQQAKLSYEEIETVYLAGTLGTKINLANATRIGLFPTKLSEKICAVGNTSLAGAASYSLHPEISSEKIKRFQNSISCLELANLPEFQNLFISHLNF